MSTGSVGVWGRKVVYEMVRNLAKAGAAEGFSVLGTLDVVRKVGLHASHFHSARFDWISSSFAQDFKRRNSAEELATRYFRSAIGRVDVVALKRAIHQILTDLRQYMVNANDRLSARNGSVAFAGARFTQKVEFGAIRVDLVVAVGCALPRVLGGSGLSLDDALIRANEVAGVHGSLPAMVHQGSRAAELHTDTVQIELEWVSLGSESTNFVKCEVNAGIFTVPPIAYNCGFANPTREVLSRTVSGEWVSVIIPTAALTSIIVQKQYLDGSGQEVWRAAGTLQNALRQCQSGTWLSTSRYGTVRIIQRNRIWVTAANNLIVNDIGDGTTPTYGSRCCATIRIYGYPAADRRINPIVPSIQCVLMDDRVTPEVGQLMKATTGGQDIEFPVILDSKSMALVPVLYTILAKADSLVRGGNVQVRKASKINLSSSFGLASPGDIFNHIDYILGALETLKPLFESLKSDDATELDKLAHNVKEQSSISFGAGMSLDGIRHGRSSAKIFLRQPANKQYACAFAWSLVSSATCIIWLVTYLATGYSPVAYPIQFAEPPREGIEALRYILSISYRQWIDFDELSRAFTVNNGLNIKNTELRMLAQLALGEGALTKKLNACKYMIRDSPNFRP